MWSVFALLGAGCGTVSAATPQEGLPRASEVAEAMETLSRVDSTLEVSAPHAPALEPSVSDSGHSTYADPSEVVVTASGRPMPLFGLTDRATARGVSDERIVIGGLVTQTLATSPHRPAVCSGAEARFALANDNQELTRSIDFIACYDDAGQSELAAALAATLVRQGAFAIVPLASPAFLAEDMLQAERVLYVGDEALPAFCGRLTSVGFGTHGARGCPVLDARGYVSLVEPVLTAYLEHRPDGADARLTYATVRGPYGEAVAASRLFEAGLLELEDLVVATTLPPVVDGSPASWDNTVQELLDSAADIIFLDGPVIDGLPGALRAAGFVGEVVVVGALDPLVVADPAQRRALAPLTVVTPGLDLANRSSAGWRTLEGAAAEIGVIAADIGLDFVEGYIAADFILQAFRDTAEPLTVERVADTLNAGWWYEGIDGVNCGNWWPASHFITTPCVSIAHVEMGSDRLVPVRALAETAPQLTFSLSAD